MLSNGIKDYLKENDEEHRVLYLEECSPSGGWEISACQIMTRGREKGGKCGKKKMGEDTGSRGKTEKIAIQRVK